MPGLSAPQCPTARRSINRHPASTCERSRRHGTTVGDVGFYLATEGYFDTSDSAGRRTGLSRQPRRGPRRRGDCERDARGELWPRGDAIDRPLYSGRRRKNGSCGRRRPQFEVPHASESARPHLYRPTPPTLGLTLLARTSGTPYQALGAIQRTLDGVGPGLVGFFPRTLDDHLAIDVSRRGPRARGHGLGKLALVLSAVGLYGLVAWFVELRRREIGVRMALGATAANVRLLIVRQALGTAIPECAAGLVLASVSCGRGAIGALRRAAAGSGGTRCGCGGAGDRRHVGELSAESTRHASRPRHGITAVTPCKVLETGRVGLVGSRVGPFTTFDPLDLTGDGQDG